ncbi:DMT family transporter [Streptomyces sp. NPDC088354]|uniref:DMT family transporter n=1 Tax=unclassified Streptomyces TaxID=2593676 RepID=UPI0029A39936|nr:EamA family transporter [Streptomyces sp. MI02-7b]MDX3074180.1 EamA family transporter [Streptomyces sp. MI02-7b]
MSLRNLSLALLVPLIWGFNFVVADEAVQGLPPFLLVALRYGVVALFFLPFTRRGGLPWRYIVAVGLLYGVVQFSGLFLGLKAGVGAGMAGTLIQAQALFTIILARMVLNESFTGPQWCGLLLGGGGLLAIALSGGGNAPLGGVLWVLLGALGWATSNIVLKKAGSLSAWRMTVWQSVSVIPPMLLLSGIFEHGQNDAVIHMSAKTAGAILYIALLATGLGNFLWYRLIQQVGPSRTAPFSLLVPVVSLVSGWLVLGEKLTALQALGVLCVLLGVAVIALAPKVTTWLAERGRVETPAELDSSTP